MKHTVLRSLIPLGLYPHIGFTYSPFKILEFQAIMEKAQLSGDETALDIGCGDGLHTLLIGKKSAQVTGIDVNTEFVETARKYAQKMGPRVKADFQDQPLEKIGFPDEHFDIIFSICVIEHIDNYEEVLRECLRILKPGGKIVFTVDTLEGVQDEALIKRHQADHHVVQYFRKDTLGSLLEGIGFSDLYLENLFRSDLARKLFSRGIKYGFNFGRFKTQALVRQLARAEATVPQDAPGMFMLASARKPGA